MHIIIDDNLYIMIHNYTFYDVLKKLYIAFLSFIVLTDLLVMSGPKNKFLVTLDPSLHSHFKIREQDSK